LTIEIAILVSIGFFIGGILKGATGAGAPLVSVPLLTLFYDAPTAVALFAIPTLIPNIWQTWHFRKHRMPTGFVARFAGAGLLGTIIGTFFLANLPTDILSIGVAVAVLLYVGLKLLIPGWRLSYQRAYPFSAVAGGLAGTMQGATGISAPISISFLNAMGLERDRFVPTISSYFIAVSITQIPLLWLYGIMTKELAMLGCAALIPLIAGMPVGNWLARYISATRFNQLTLLILFVLALRLLFAAVY